MNWAATPKVVLAQSGIFMKMSLCGAKLINMVQISQYLFDQTEITLFLLLEFCLSDCILMKSLMCVIGVNSGA